MGYIQEYIILFLKPTIY